MKSAQIEVVCTVIQELFPKELSDHDICTAAHCTSFSKSEIQRQLLVNKDKKKEKVFNHDWLLGNDSFCPRGNCYFAVFVEGQGVYCLLCRRHNSKSSQNKSEKFAAIPSTRFKSSALTDHREAGVHKSTVTVHATQKSSTFHKEGETKKASRNKTVEAVMRNAYFVMKEDLPVTKLTKMNELLDLQGNKEIRFFKHDSERVVGEIVTAVGHAVQESYLSDLRQATCFGLLVDDLTDVSVKELMVTFVQYIDPSGKLQTKFLFVRNLLKDSHSANAITIHNNIMEGLRSLDIDTEKFASICTDGAAVMVGRKNGLAGLLRKSLPKILTFHCICHKLALAASR